MASRSSSTSSFDGIVLRSYPSGDADLVLKILLDSGRKIAVFARSARKAKKTFTSQPEPFDYGTFELRPRPKGAGLTTLASFQPRGAFHHLRQGISAMSLACVLCEAFDYLVKDEQEDHPEIHTLLQLSLQSLDEGRNDNDLFRAVYIALAELLRLSGFLNLEKYFGAGEALPPPSSKNLLKLIQHIEDVCEHSLKTKETLHFLLEGLKRNEQLAVK